MSWSLDWFAAEKLGRAGAQIRRAGWTDRFLTGEPVDERGVIWLITITGNPARVLRTTDFGADELNARDWTDQPFNANPCSATPAFNTAPPPYGQWTDQPVQLPPPVPGYPS